MARVAVHMPKYGMTMESGLIVEWLVHEGDQVQEGDSIAIINTEKVDTELGAPASGTLVKISAEADSEVPVGGIIAYIEKSE
jgi:2-oxoglutarate dehydrogenase E2 component (dihydrolipoamide succinyltransferase)